MINCLRLTNRQIITSSLTTLNSMVDHYAAKSTTFSSHSVSIIEQSSKLINENDLFVSQLSVSLISSVIRVQPDSFQQINHSVFIKSVESLVKSPYLESASLESLSHLYINILNSKTKNFSKIYFLLFFIFYFLFFILFFIIFIIFIYFLFIFIYFYFSV